MPLTDWVLDTNVLISAVLSSQGAPHALAQHILKNGNLVFSSATFEELRSRIYRPKFDVYLSLEMREALLAHGLVFFAGLNAFCYLELPEFFRLPGTGKSLHSLGRNRSLIANMELVVSSAVCLRHWTAQWSKYNFPTKVLLPTKTSQPKHPRYSA